MAGRAEKVASGERPLKKDRFVTFTDTSTSVNGDLAELAELGPAKPARSSQVL